MDSDELVRRISDEVLKRLGPGSQEAGAPSSGTPAAAGYAPPATPKNRRVLVVLTGADRRLDEVCVQLGKIAGCAESTTVVLSPSAERNLGVPAVRRAAPEARVVCEGEVARLIEGVSVVYLPSLSLNAASKIANLIPDSLACILAISGLVRGTTVVAARDTLLPADVDPAALPAGVTRKIDELLRGLESMGVRLCEVDKMTGPGQVVDPATGQARPNPVCTLAAGEECSECGLCAQNHPQAEIGRAHV